ncbi:unnamed protein product [Paramecium sonneborni]|uniref:ABC transmembrane type-1 domain-containing protein n=1 Tax=Paramecium sonneborni TaxID=65129 RepID=A0A8S1RKJ7_9CILI|nr:unnamed protein product [Paramecium sonneborni]
MEDDKETQNGIILVFSIIGTRIISVICQQYSNYQIRLVGYDWISILSMALLGKSMNVSYQSNKEHTSGQVLNYMQVDAMNYNGLVVIISNFNIHDVQIYRNSISWRFRSNLFDSNLQYFCWSKDNGLSNFYDERQRQKNNLCQRNLLQIKFIKVNAYEEYFRSKLIQYRNQEIKTLKTRFFASCLNILSAWLSPMLILNATFLIYVAIGNDLTPANTFAIISLFQSLQGPLLFLPMALNALIEANISFQRVQRFLLTKELMNDCK